MTGAARVLTLASTSPRRRQLLEMLGLPVVVSPSHIPEVRADDERPVEYTTRLARAKAESVGGEFVLGADTTVALDDHVLEKPADFEDAVRMLMLLQGRTHDVVTTVALVAGGITRTRTDITQVTFRAAERTFLEAYVATGEPMDKAGAYHVDGRGAAFITTIGGSPSNVAGLPLRTVLELARAAGVDLLA